MADPLELTDAQIREGIVMQFRFSFSLSDAKAEEAANEAMADPEFVQATRLSTMKLIAIAERSGWTRP